MSEVLEQMERRIRHARRGDLKLRDFTISELDARRLAKELAGWNSSEASILRVMQSGKFSMLGVPVKVASA